VVWRSVMISKPAKLKREHFSLAIEQEATAFVPFEDIAVVVLNHREISLTHSVLSACAEYGISLFATGDNHQPSGVFLPFLQHSRATRMLRLQLELPKPIAKQTWAAIVRGKISNQAECLRLVGADGHDRLESYARRIRSGDSENLEGQAAAFYFPKLFDANFHRSQDRWTNAALNYGYAVLRGTIARGLVAHGLLPSLGLFHSSEQNAFNLADDLIEPFRPLVDLYVATQTTHDDNELQPTDKVALVALLNTDIGMPRGVMSALSAIEQAVESLVRIYDGGGASVLELPTLIGLQQHRAE
jgi:CRISP-associated protein Cas1